MRIEVIKLCPPPPLWVAKATNFPLKCSRKSSVLVESHAMKLFRTGGIEPLYSGAQTISPLAALIASEAALKPGISTPFSSCSVVYSGRSKSQRWNVLNGMPFEANCCSKALASATFFPDEATRMVTLSMLRRVTGPSSTQGYQMNYHLILYAINNPPRIVGTRAMANNPRIKPCTSPSSFVA